ncbi:tRNA (adenosine(37)-N6)-threonylcarbamoyltransferase complex dimerization subunit type 1 TsaB [Novosphingobium huizhouense]|uniref:tRNA (adenosine(37)-N6)-threonylcarbamoyltransferase complex dimerization subunit type 1 TsaB n=1 Tax=Novosphingobium huizhouense TaxID=2866625 RepID=UPI001CD88EF8|nr:tRNA (adenosine(37)-N6)-threonylcarbamoyltransferase complex dimerization subunit type 1 TsaB [Novosphingobium huizhouense]
MRRLVIDSATEACSVALFDDARLVAGECAMLGRGHAERLVPMVAALPGKGRAEAIAVDLGPGSFTGIRVGLAAARALALAWGVPVAGYDSLSLLAAMAAQAHPGHSIDVVTTGGHGEWFFRAFDAAGAPLAPLLSAAPEAVAAQSRGAVIAGSQAEALAALRQAAPAAILPLWPDAQRFDLLPAGLLTTETHARYGRPPDARLPGAA